MFVCWPCRRRMGESSCCTCQGMTYNVGDFRPPKYKDHKAWKRLHEAWLAGDKFPFRNGIGKLDCLDRQLLHAQMNADKRALDDFWYKGYICKNSLPVWRSYCCGLLNNDYLDNPEENACVKWRWNQLNTDALRNNIDNRLILLPSDNKGIQVVEYARHYKAIDKAGNMVPNTPKEKVLKGY